MRPHIPHIIAAALVLLVCHAAFDRAGAKVVRDGKGAPSNPAVDAGGLRLRPAPSSSQVPYSLVGAVANENRWIGSCSVWDWRPLDQIAPHRHRVRARMTVGPFDDVRFSRFPTLVK